MITLKCVLEPQEQIPGVWYVRISLNKNGAEYESDFLKFCQIEKPTVAQLQPVIEEYLVRRNTPQVIQTSSSLIEVPVSLLISQQVPKLGDVWRVFKAWFLSLFWRSK
jgi:hypothetical protein